MIPSELIAPIIEDGYGRYGMIAVELMVGLPQRTLFRIVRDSNATGFELADRIVTALAGASAWQEPPHRGWYCSHAAVLRQRC
jgi:hypothetical protein